ncbi:MAG: hypothetical protein KAT85_10365 [candidate division Zixibacteria bacterium]|nr:hypothetical protein [candidate division Zixibacteria bacterium]
MNVIRFIVSAYMLLLLAAWLTDSTGLWGVYHLIFLPNGLAWLLIAIAAIVLWLPRRFADAVGRTVNRKISRLSETMIVSFFLICSIAVFVAARSRTLLLGDSYKLLAQITEPLIFLPTEQLNLIVHSSLYKLIGSADVAYLVISLVAGVFFLAAVFVFVTRVIGNRTGRIAGIVLFLGLAQIQFFFGYVENYAVMTLFTTLFLLLGWLSITSQVAEREW